MNRSFDYWADVALNDNPATVGDLRLRLRDESKGRGNVTFNEGEAVYHYIQGDIVVRGRFETGPAYKLTIVPRGFTRTAFKKNLETLKMVVEESGIKLKCVSE